ncbi:MAG: hypothetical protein ACRD8Z_28745, partial [Nitrososphaeraceae archaeon]
MGSNLLQTISIHKHREVFKTLFKRLGIEHEVDILPPEEKFFSGIVGYADLKKLFMRSIISREPSHILLTG